VLLDYLLFEIDNGRSASPRTPGDAGEQRARSGRSSPSSARQPDGAPNWSIEKRYLKVLYETGHSDRAIAELQDWLRTQRYRAEFWQLLSELLAKTGRGASRQGARNG
jgi:predicted Zn-dependent protease